MSAPVMNMEILKYMIFSYIGTFVSKNVRCVNFISFVMNHSNLDYFSKFILIITFVDMVLCKAFSLNNNISDNLFWHGFDMSPTMKTFSKLFGFFSHYC